MAFGCWTVRTSRRLVRGWSTYPGLSSPAGVGPENGYIESIYHRNLAPGPRRPTVRRRRPAHAKSGRLTAAGGLTFKTASAGVVGGPGGLYPFGLGRPGPPASAAGLAAVVLVGRHRLIEVGFWGVRGLAGSGDLVCSGADGGQARHGR